MVSRKKNKGKERKTKQAEKVAERGKRSMQKFWNGVSIETVAKCEHGKGLAATKMPDDNHPFTRFIHTFFINWEQNLMVPTNLLYTFKTHRSMEGDETHCKLAINLLTNMGTNLMLVEPYKVVYSCNSAYAARAIVILEAYRVTGDIKLAVLISAAKWRDLFHSKGTRRDLLKFYSKRISCSCLKEMYSGIRKTMPKTGQCYGCSAEYVRSSLLVCSRCRVDQYCSRECQVAHWPEHRMVCDAYTRARHQFSVQSLEGA